MFRKVTAALVGAALALLASAPPLHVHQYVGHDHPEHHHGPAAHPNHSGDRHQHGASSRVDRGKDARHIEACEPGEHALSIVFTCVSVDSHVASSAPSGVASIVTPTAPRWLRLASSDVRAHGPPGVVHAPLRAPPAVRLA